MIRDQNDLPARNEDLASATGLMWFMVSIAALGILAVGLATLLHTLFPRAHVGLCFTAICLPLACWLAIGIRRTNAISAHDGCGSRIEAIVLLLLVVPQAALLCELVPVSGDWIFVFALAAFFLPGAWRERKISDWLASARG